MVNLNIKLKKENCIKAVIGSLILAFGVYNIHSISMVTEGGIIGITLLLDHWFNISPAISNFVLTSICFYFGYSQLGKEFVYNSLIAYSCYSVFYGIFEQFPRIYPEIVNYPLLAAISGAIFVGVGAGIAVTGMAATAGDDALAMGLAHKFKMPIVVGYGILDAVVLVFSLSYIPFKRIIFSIITVLISGGIIAIISRNTDI